MPSTVKIPSPTVYNAVVGPGGYATISEACMAEPVGATIAVLPGIYTEVDDIYPLEGQTIFALGGPGDSVVVDMGDYKIDADNNSVQFIGIKFNFEALTNESKAWFYANNQVVRDCTFDFSSCVNAHQGLYVSGNFIALSGITIIGSAFTEAPMYVEMSRDCSFANIVIQDCIITAAFNALVTCYDNQRCRWNGINIEFAASTTGGSYFYIVGTTSASHDPCFYSDIRMTGSNADDVGILYDSTGSLSIKADQWSNVSIEGMLYGISITYISGIQMTNVIMGSNYYTATGIYLDAVADFNLSNFKATCQAECILFSGNYSEACQFSNCNLETSGATAIYVQGYSSYVAFSNAITSSGADVLLYGAGPAEFANCEIPGTIDIDDSYNVVLANCDLSIISVGLTVMTLDTRISNSYIGSIFNHEYAIHTVMCGTGGANITDDGQDTVIDVYRLENATSDTDIRGSTSYGNLGAGGEVVLTLPDPASVQVSVGFRFRVIVEEDTKNIKIAQSALQVIQDGNSSTVPGEDSGIENSAVGAVVDLVYMGSNTWFVVSAHGNDWAAYSPS